MPTKKRKRKASAFNLRVGKFRKQGLSFKDAVQKAKDPAKKRINTQGSNKLSMPRGKRRSPVRRIRRFLAKRRGRSRVKKFSWTKDGPSMAVIGGTRPYVRGYFINPIDGFALNAPVAEFGIAIAAAALGGNRAGFRGAAGRTAAHCYGADGFEKLIHVTIPLILGRQPFGGGL